MRYLSVVLLLLASACQPANSRLPALEKKIDSLQNIIDHSYKPGFGEFMSSIQVHHAKLWFAGTHSNWQLADFEIHEIGEALDDIRQYQSERKESKLLYFLNPGLDSLSSAISQQDQGLFRKSFQLLTDNCNSCHWEVSYGFNQVRIPDSPPFSNQVFDASSK